MRYDILQKTTGAGFLNHQQSDKLMKNYPEQHILPKAHSKSPWKIGKIGPKRKVFFKKASTLKGKAFREATPLNGVTPNKINMEPENDGTGKMMFRISIRDFRFHVNFPGSYTPGSTNIAMENAPGLKMCCLLKLEIFQQAMLVYQRVAHLYPPGN